MLTRPNRNVAEKRKVILGERSSSEEEVIEGIAPRETVIVSNMNPYKGKEVKCNLKINEMNMRNLFLISLILINCFGCIGRKQEKSRRDNSLQQSGDQKSSILSTEINIRDTTVHLENPVDIDKNENVRFLEEEDISDTIGEYQIFFRIVYNEKIFYLNGTAYADKEIILAVKKGDACILNETKFNRTDFASIINPYVMDKILLWKGEILDVNSGYIVIGVSATIPETDMLYDIKLTIHDDGQLVISGEEILMEEEQ